MSELCKVMKSSVSFSSFVEEIMFLSGDVNNSEKCTVSEDDPTAVQEVMTVTGINISSVSDSVADVNDISATAAVTNSELLANTVNSTMGCIHETMVNEFMMREDPVNISANSTVLPECAETGTGYAFGTSDIAGESNSSTISEYNTISEISLNSANGVHCYVKRKPAKRNDEAKNNVVNHVIQEMMESSTKGEFSDYQAFHGYYAHDEDKTCIDNVGSEHNHNVFEFKDCKYWHDDSVSVDCNNCMYNSNHCHVANVMKRGTFCRSSNCHHSSHLERSQSSVYPTKNITVSGSREPLESRSYQLNSGSLANSCHGNCDDCNDGCSPGASHDIIQLQAGREIRDASSAAADMISTCASSEIQNITMNSGFGQQASVSFSEAADKAANASDMPVMKVSVDSY